MTRYVIDAPTLVHLAVHELQPNPVHQIVAPGDVRYRALTLLYEAVRRGELAEELALKHHQRLTELKLRLLGDRVSRQTAWKIAREHEWETLDAAECIALVRLQADALITVDARLADKAEGLVPIADLAALTT